jgi:hypothetical protein
LLDKLQFHGIKEKFLEWSNFISGIDLKK